MDINEQFVQACNATGVGLTNSTIKHPTVGMGFLSVWSLRTET